MRYLLLLLILSTLQAAEVQVVTLEDGRELHAYVEDHPDRDERWARLAIMHQGQQMGSLAVRRADIVETRDLTPEEVDEHRPKADVVAAVEEENDAQVQSGRDKLDAMEQEIRDLNSTISESEKRLRDARVERRQLRDRLLAEWARDQDWSELTKAHPGYGGEFFEEVNRNLMAVRVLINGGVDDARRMAAAVRKAIPDGERWRRGEAAVLKHNGRPAEIPDHLR